MTKRRYSAAENLESFAVSSFDWNLCILCQEKTNEKLICPANVNRRNPDNHDPNKTYQDILTNLNRFIDLGEAPFTRICIPDTFLDSMNSEIYVDNMGKFHKTCKSKVSDMKLERAEKRRHSSHLETSQHFVDHQTSLDTFDDVEIRINDADKRISSRKSEVDVKKICFFCESEEGELHAASTFKMDQKVRSYAKQLQDSELIAKLSQGDLIAQDALYHTNCLMKLYNKARERKVIDDDEIDQIHGTAFAELVCFMERCREEDKNSIFKLSELAALYGNRIKSFGRQIPDRVHTTRLKIRLLAYFEDLREFKEGKNILLAFDDELGAVLKTFFENSFDDDALILARAANILRKDFLKPIYPSFNGTFTNDCQKKFLPEMLTSFMEMLLQGPSINQNHKYLEQSNLTISQLIVQNAVKRTRKESVSSYFSKTKESPISIYVGMMIHAKTRKKGIIDRLYNLGISIPYNRVLELSTSLGNTVLSQYEQDGIVCPRSLQTNTFTTAALDNIDHNPSSSTAEGSFHGTGISIFQHMTQNEQPNSRILVSTNRSIPLPASYTEITPISFFKNQPECRDYSKVADRIEGDGSKEERLEKDN